MDEYVNQTPMQPDVPPISRASRQAFWRRIYLPFLAGLILLTAAGFGITVGEVWSLRGWADLSVVLLIFPLLFVGAVGVIILFLLAAGVNRLLTWIPMAARTVTHILHRISITLRDISDMLVKPLLVMGSLAASLRQGIASFSSFFRTLEDE